MPAFDVVVIGAGAAGMMCAAQAGQRGRSVLLIEHYRRARREDPHLRRRSLQLHQHPARPAQLPVAQSGLLPLGARALHAAHFVALVERHGIAYHEKKLGQLFCDDAAQDIIRMLKAECDRGHVAWRMPCAVERVCAGRIRLRRRDAAGPASRRVAGDRDRRPDRPKIGATPFGVPDRRTVRARRRCRRGRRSCRSRLRPSAGALRRPVRASRWTRRCRATAGRFRENLLFTHRGLSGPAILQISSYWDGRTPLRSTCCRAWSALACDRDAEPTRSCPSCWREHLPKRFAQRGARRRSVARPMREVGDAAARVAARLHAWRVLPSGTLGYNKAEVTLGGVDTRGLSSRTMAATGAAGPLLHRRSRSTSPAGSAGTISNGRGRRDTPPAQFA